MSRLILAVIAIVVLVGLVLAATGALHFRNTEDQSSVTIDKKELKEKTQEVLKKTQDAGGQVLDKTGEALHKAADGLRKSPNDRSATPAPATPGGDDKPQPDDKADPTKGSKHESHL